MSAERQMIPYTEYQEVPLEKMKHRAWDFSKSMQKRRTIRHFSPRNVPHEIIKDCLRAACSAPSGANKQPWHFVVVSDPSTKKQIREAAEACEQKYYSKEATKSWVSALAPLGTNASKPFLEIVPYLIAVFAEQYGLTETGERIAHYYVSESVCLAVGILITGLHLAGLASLTYTPQPNRFLNDILNRPRRERPVMILVTGYPADGAEVPDLKRKSLDEVTTFV